MWQQWLRYIRNFFGFTRGEARGFSLMLVLIVLVYTAWFVYRLLPAEHYNPIADQRQLDSLVSLLEAADTVSVPEGGALADKSTTIAQQLFFFNPNTLSEDSLRLLGFPPYLAQRMVRYREKGGRFRKKEDLLKLYGIEEALYRQLAPWISLPQQQKVAKQRELTPAWAAQKKEAPKQPLQKFDLNKADSLQLLSVRGIGPVLSGRILKFREGLGGFVHAEQLKEVWGLPPETAEILLERGYISPDAQPRMLAINTASASELALHPYISHKQANQIVAYRRQHGNFQKPADLMAIHSLDEQFVEKLKPYLQF